MLKFHCIDSPEEYGWHEYKPNEYKREDNLKHEK
jgi:hypothetical protein